MQKVMPDPISVQIVTEECFMLEQLLRSLGADGYGLGKLVDSVDNILPKTLTRQIYIISHIRNGVLHKGRPLNDVDRFRRTCADARHDLEYLAPLLVGPSDEDVMLVD